MRVPVSGAARAPHRTLSQLLPFATLLAFLAFLSVSFLAVTGVHASTQFGALHGVELAVTWMIGASLVGRAHSS